MAPDKAYGKLLMLTIVDHIVEHGLQGSIVKNIEGESKEANDLSHIL